MGAGILLGVYLMSWVADRYGRRPAILLATLLGGFCIWPFAYVTNFWGMVVLSVLSTLGVGGIVATHSVYLSEMTSPDDTQQGAACLAGRHRAGRGRRQPAGVLADSRSLAGLPVDQRDHRNRRAAALAVLEAAGIAALAGGAWPARGSRARHGGVRTPGAAIQQRATAGTEGRRQSCGHGRPGRLEGAVHQSAVPRSHLVADRLLDARLCRTDLRRRCILRGLHGGPRRRRALRVPDHRGGLPGAVRGISGERAAR